MSTNPKSKAPPRPPPGSSQLGAPAGPTANAKKAPPPPPKAGARQGAAAASAKGVPASNKRPVLGGGASSSSGALGPPQKRAKADGLSVAEADPWAMMEQVSGNYGPSSSSSSNSAPASGKNTKGGGNYGKQASGSNKGAFKGAAPQPQQWQPSWKGHDVVKPAGKMQLQTEENRPQPYVPPPRAMTKSGKRQKGVKPPPGGGGGGSSSFFSNTRVVDTSAATASATAKGKGPQRPNGADLAAHGGFDAFEFLRQEDARSVQEFGENTFWHKLLSANANALADAYIREKSGFRRGGGLTHAHHFSDPLWIADGPDLQRRPDRFESWTHYRDFWGHFVVAEARAQVQQMIGSCVVEGGGKRRTAQQRQDMWHTVQLQKFGANSVQVQMLQKINSSRNRGLVSTSNSVCVLRNPRNGQRLLLMRPTRPLSYDMESQWSLCQVVDADWEDFSQKETKLRAELCTFGNACNMVSIGRELGAVLEAEKALNSGAARSNLGGLVGEREQDPRGLAGTRVGQVILRGQLDAQGAGADGGSNGNAEYRLTPEQRYQRERRLHVLKFFNSSNQSQRDVVFRADLVKEGFLLVHGPPGTGKSTTLHWALNLIFLRDVDLWWTEFRQRVLDGGYPNTIEGWVKAWDAPTARVPRMLVCAPSNQAVDEIYRRVDKFWHPSGSQWPPSKYRQLASQFRASDTDKRVRRWMRTPKEEIKSGQLKLRALREHRGKITAIENLVNRVRKLVAKCPKQMPLDWQVVYNEGAGGQVSYRQNPPNTGWKPFWPEPFEPDPLQAIQKPWMAECRQLLHDLQYKTLHDLRAYRTELRRVDYMEKNADLFPLLLQRKTTKQQLKNQKKSAGFMKVKDFFTQLIAEAADLVFATANQSGSLVFTQPCSSLVIDEACQATECSSLIPIVASRSKSVILVGDPHQLPATLLNPHLDPINNFPAAHGKTKNSNTTIMSNNGGAATSAMTYSLFDRLQKNDIQHLLLDTQYRMHPEISAFPSKEFYDACVFDDPGYADVQHVVKDELYNLRMVDTSLLPDRREERVGTSWKNECEAKVVEQLVEFVQKVHPWMEVQVICPYVGQQQRLKRLEKNKGVTNLTARDYFQNRLPNGATAQVSVSTIDACQGSEAMCVIFNLVRSNENGEMGFLAKDFRRVNVALTRAERHLFVVGDLDTVRKCGRGSGAGAGENGRWDGAMKNARGEERGGHYHAGSFLQRWAAHLTRHKCVVQLPPHCVTVSAGRGVSLNPADVRNEFHRSLYRTCQVCQMKQRLENLYVRRADTRMPDVVCATCRASRLVAPVRKAVDVNKRKELVNKMITFDESFPIEVGGSLSERKPIDEEDSFDDTAADALIAELLASAAASESPAAGEAKMRAQLQRALWSNDGLDIGGSTPAPNDSRDREASDDEGSSEDGDEDDARSRCRTDPPSVADARRLVAHPFDADGLERAIPWLRSAKLKTGLNYLYKRGQKWRTLYLDAHLTDKSNPAGQGGGVATGGGGKPPVVGGPTTSAGAPTSTITSKGGASTGASGGKVFSSVNAGKGAGTATSKGGVQGGARKGGDAAAAPETKGATRPQPSGNSRSVGTFSLASFTAARKRAAQGKPE